MNPGKAKLDIVIVNWNTGRLLANCLRALAAASDREVINKVWVVDNDSHDGSMQLAREVTGEFEFIELKRNLGFAAGNNVAIEKIMNSDDDRSRISSPEGSGSGMTDMPHVLLLNPDTEIRDGALTAMLKVLDEKNDVGIVGPKLVNLDGSLQPSVRPFPKFHDFMLYMLKLGRFIQKRQENAHDYSVSGYVDQVMGAAFLIRNKALQDVGPMDDGYFTLFEEVDYAKTALSAGWKSYFTSAGEVMHVKAASFNQLVGFKRSWPWLKSSLRYARKHVGWWAWLVMIIMLPLTLLLILPASLKHYVLTVLNRKRI